MPIKHRYFRPASIILVGCMLFIASALSGCCPPICIKPTPTPDPASLHNKNYRFVIPKAQQGVLPTIDGATATAPNFTPDPLWKNAAKFDLDLGANIPAAQMWAVADNDNVYMYFEIEGAFDSQDVLVLLLGPNPAGGDYRRLHIKPCGPLGITGNCPSTAELGHATKVDYWTGTYTKNPTPPATQWSWVNANLPTGFEAKSAFQVASGSTPSKWAIEVKLPIAGFTLPATQFFGLYVDIIDKAGATTVIGYPWPPKDPNGNSNIISGPGSLQQNTPFPERWGLATLSDSFGNGVYITSSDIRTNHSQSPVQISLTGQNRFYADVHNNLSQAGQLTDANNVRATFKIANWGVGTQWVDVPTGGPGVSGAINVNPTSRETIVATGSRQYEIGPWALNPQEQTDYRNNFHQCIRVDLDTNDPNTLFFQNSAQQNMDFVETQSPFKRTASVGLGEIKQPERSDKQVIILRERFYNTDPKLPWRSEIGLERSGNDYVARVKPGNEKGAIPFDVAVEPPAIELARTTMKVPANIDKVVELSVKPGELVTILARGSILLRKDLGSATEVGPSGRDFTSANELFDAVYRGAITRDKKRSTSNKAYPLLAQQSPEMRAGALIGSWDGFRESSFVIGQAVTLKVPRSVNTLSLAVNDLKDTGKLRDGKGFEVDVISTPLRPYHGLGNPMVWQDNPSLPVGANLPTWIMRGAVDSGKVIEIDGETFKVLEPIGSFGAIVTKIGR